MRKLFLLFAAFCSVAVAESLPIIIGYIPNRASGQITLTGELCSGSKDEKFVFVKDDGGKLSMSGCWTLIGNDVIVRWSDGDVYSYSAGSIVFSNEFNEWYSKQKPGQKVY
jgi:hypothetical protein